MSVLVEICCGSYEDAEAAYQAGARRVELNSGLYLGGLTPGLGTLKLVKQNTDLQVISMLRPRGAGFCYTQMEWESMLADAEELLHAGTDGIAFGFLDEDGAIDRQRTLEMTERIHAAGKTAVFHRAFDCTGASDEAMETLISLGVDRVLTSGGKKTAIRGQEVIRHLVKNYGREISILAGSGVNASNARELVRQTGVKELHSSCRTWRVDPTTENGEVSYHFAEGTRRRMYDLVSGAKIRELLGAVQAI